MKNNQMESGYQIHYTTNMNICQYVYKKKKKMYIFIRNIQIQLCNNIFINSLILLKRIWRVKFMKRAVFVTLIAVCGLLFFKSGIFSVKKNEAKKKIPSTSEASIVPVDYDTYTPLNHEKQYAMWFPAMDYQKILLNKSEDEFREATAERFRNAKELGINTLYVHVRSNCDAYYNSSIFPHGEFFSEDSTFDPLEIMIDTAHSMGLSFHAWINPMRVQKTEQLENMSDNYKVKQWYNDNTKNGIYIVQSENMWYLNPAYSEVRSLISQGIFEIIENYKVDGIHIDDYFYPTESEEFDRPAFEESGENNLNEWRINNTSLMVSQIYSTINAVNPEILFGISPQGNIDTNYSSQCADVRKWSSEKGYCDYIVPQLYYGFKNSTCPYEKTLDEWSEIATSADLISGVCTYKIGTEDKWAGSGINEWITDKDITARQIEYALKDENVDGIAIYSYSSTFEREDIFSSINLDIY